MLQRAATRVTIAGKTGDSCGFECQSVLEEIRNGGENEREKREFQRLNRICARCGGSAVGVGNIWRFPYLCAKDGGGLFLIIYLVLVLTFGFVLLTTDVAIGEENKEKCTECICCDLSEVEISGISDVSGPVLIMTYYSVIGGWITKYFVEYLVSGDNVPAQDGYFTSFITSKAAPIVFMLLFLVLTAAVVYSGVEKGIEKVSSFIMPVLVVLIVAIAVFSLTLSAEGRMVRFGRECRDWRFICCRIFMD